MNQQEPSEPPHGGAASGDPSPEIDPETAAWIAGLEAEAAEAAASPPSKLTVEEILAGNQQASQGWMRRLQQEPWLTWGNGSDTVEKALQPLDPKQAEQVKWLAVQVEEQFCFQVDLSNTKAAKTWVCGLVECVKASRGQPSRAVEAGWKLINADRTIADPWSLVKTTAAIAAAQEREAKHGTRQSGDSEGRWTNADIERANAQAAADLGE